MSVREVRVAVGAEAAIAVGAVAFRCRRDSLPSATDAIRRESPNLPSPSIDGIDAPSKELSNEPSVAARSQRRDALSRREGGRFDGRHCGVVDGAEVGIVM